MFRAKAYGNKGKKVCDTFNSRDAAEAQLLAWLGEGYMVGSVGPVLK
ncbi:hypothetical protein [Burkholderia aenigmatica]|nr:hypothetical protein [Burkholderia aenigmatica]MDN7880085.1 hypothetical protein [Burkholderia aenigmatica]